MKAVCGHCGRHLGGNSRNGTKHLHNHLDRCPVRKAQNVTNPNKTTDGSPAVTTHTFDPEVARKKLAHMIILHEYPLSMVEHIGFIEFLNFICPSFQVVSRNTIRSDILK
ncbi:Zinc finger, BED-type, partial [Trema orientale]